MFRLRLTRCGYPAKTIARHMKRFTDNHIQPTRNVFLYNVTTFDVRTRYDLAAKRILSKYKHSNGRDKFSCAYRCQKKLKSYLLTNGKLHTKVQKHLCITELSLP